MSNVIELNAGRSSMAKQPVRIWDLRWRVILDSGVQLTSAWLPEFRYPSMQETLREFSDRIQMVCIDGKNLYDGQTATFLRCPGTAFATFSYKAGGYLARGRSEVIGIEVEDLDGVKYLVLRDGTVYVEERAADVANDH